jgi:hypothetical protein
VGYLAGTIIAVLSGAILVAVIYVQHELHGPASRPAPVYTRSAARRVRRAPRARRARRAAPGDSCVCGGTVGRTGKTSVRFGDLLGCTGCARSWTMDGRRTIRRRPGSYPAAGRTVAEKTHRAPQEQRPAD